MEIKVTLTANAGIVVTTGPYCVWLDALHEQKQPGFSAVPTEILAKLPAPTHICYTHCHGDHFSERLTRLAQTHYPNAKVYLPESRLQNQTLVTDQNRHFTDGVLSLEFIRLPHEGAQYAQVPHYGLVLSFNGKTVLATGDCATASPVLLDAIGERHVDIAVMDFPWLALPRGRRALENMDVGHILVCHLPFAQNDCNGYQEAARRSLSAMAGDVRLLTEPLQTESY